MDCFSRTRISRDMHCSGASSLLRSPLEALRCGYRLDVRLCVSSTRVSYVSTEPDFAIRLLREHLDSPGVPGIGRTCIRGARSGTPVDAGSPAVRCHRHIGGAALARQLLHIWPPEGEIILALRHRPRRHRCRSFLETPLGVGRGYDWAGSGRVWPYSALSEHRLELES